jgi:hypothetical protein
MVCLCGSTDHQRTSHLKCPLNKKRIADTAPDGPANKVIILIFGFNLFKIAKK